VTAKQPVVIISGNQPEEGIDGYGGKDFKMTVVTVNKMSAYQDTRQLGHQRTLIGDDICRSFCA